MNKKNEAANPWSVPVAVDDIPDTGLHRQVAAPVEALPALATLAGVTTLRDLSAEFDLTRRGARVHVIGRVSAQVGQTCVVTLDPIETAVDEPIDITFAPAAAGGPVPDRDERGHNPADDPPEPLIDGTVDLGAIAVEFLILAIDPYPRKAGVEFTPPKVENDAPHPFAALEVLKKSPGNGQS